MTLAMEANSPPAFQAEELELDGPQPGAGEGVVERVTRAGARVRIGSRTLEASLAVPARPGDRVIVLESARGAWVLGSLSALARETSDGVSATVHDDVLVVRGADGELLFSHDARTGKSHIVSRALTIQADTVGIEGRDVSIAAHQQIDMTVGTQRLWLGRAETRLEGERLTTKLEEGRFSIREVIFGAHTIETSARALRQVYDVVERRADQVIERTRDSFREIEGVDRTRSGRIRLVAKKAFSLLTESASLRAERELAIAAAKIELG